MCRNRGLGDHHFICIYDAEAFADELIQLVSTVWNLKPYFSFLLIVQDLCVTNLLLSNSKSLIDV